MTEPAGEPEISQVDYRFTLANERTYLAWVRTSLALVAGGIALSELVSGASVLREVLALALVGCGGSGALLAYRRWVTTEEAMRAGGPLPPSPLPRVLALVLLVVAALTLVLVLLGASR